MQWVTTGYLLVITICLPIMGKLGDKYSHRNIHNYGYLVFTISSVLVALSWNVASLLLFRTMQAIGAAMYQATNIALISIHQPKESRGRALGFVSTAVALGGMAGPLAGGFIMQFLSWEWLFLIHVPASVAATFLAFRYIPKRIDGEEDNVPFDRTGAALFAAFFGIVIYAVTQANNGPLFSSGIWMTTSAAVIVFLLFLSWEKQQAHPFIATQLFLKPVVTVGLLVSFVAFLVVNNLLVVFPFYVTGLVGLSLHSAGMLMMTYPIALALSGPITGFLSDRFGSKLFPLTGLVLMGGGSLVLSFWLDTVSPIVLAIVLLVTGVGMGLIATPINSVILRHIPTSHSGSAGGLIALSRNAGMAIGSAIGLGMMNHTGGVGNTVLPVFSRVFILNVTFCFIGVILYAYAIRKSKNTSQSAMGKEVQK